MKTLYMHLDKIFGAIIAIWNIATLETVNLIVGIALGHVMMSWYGWKFIDKMRGKEKKKNED